MRSLPSILIALSALALAACGDKAPTGDLAEKAPAAEKAAEAAPAEKAAEKPAPKLDFPGTAEGAEALVKGFQAAGADTAQLSAALRPTKADYEAVFVGEAAAKAQSVYDGAWDAGQMHIRPKDGQTAALVFAATSEQLAAGGPEAEAFPGGYKQIASQLKPGLTLYRFKFVEPGKDIGMAFDGLVHVNGRWTIFPKPWRALK